jgi:lipopolysaccharide biosynthesis glycosyltransferase
MQGKPIGTDLPISISCASDEAYYCGLLVTLHSLVSHAKEGSRLVCHVLDTGLSENSRVDLTSRISSIPGRSAKVVFHSIETLSFEDLPTWRGSHTAYVRLLLQDILQDEDYTIYTDVDTLWLRDVSELWAMRDQVPVLAAAPDGSGLREFSSGDERAQKFSEYGKSIAPDRYYCSALMLMNLKELRNRNFTAQWREFVKADYDIIKFADQDVYNWFFQSSDILCLDFVWGEFSVSYGQREMLSPRVIHYANAAPWKKSVNTVNALWWGYILNNLQDSKIAFRAKLESIKYSFLRSVIGFNLIYGLLSIFNRKIYRKKSKSIMQKGLR